MDYGLLFILLLVSALYASVGHGGASGYLAIMALYGFSPEVMKPTALVLNLFVAGVSFIHFYRNGYFKPGLFGWFVITSIPAAFIGGMIDLDPYIYRKVLGVLLIFAVLRMLGVFGKMQKEAQSPSRALAMLVGLCIGFFSGIIGIGGGILLSPVILLLGWADVKQTAAISALFIWINSLAGLAGDYSNGLQISAQILPLIVVTICGGFLGSYLGSFRFNEVRLRQALSFVLALACLKLIWM